MTKERPGVMKAFIILMVINAIITSVHYILIYIGVIPIKGDMATVMEFALADAIVTVIPSVIGAYGLWQLKAWSLVPIMVLSGGYFHGMVVLLTQAVTKSKYGGMNFVSIYFIFFSILLIIYLWKKRELFN